MWKTVLLFLCLALLGWAAARLADEPGALTLEWGIWRLETSPAVALLALLALAVVTLIAARIWGFFIAGPAALARRRGDQRRARGYAALSRGLVAVAAGDAREAKKLAKRTAVLLDDPPLTLLLSAQAAQLDGDEAGAKAHFEAMRGQEVTEFLGLRGLLVQARRDGDDEGALRLARRAYELRPDTRWVVSECFALEAQQGQWDKARAIAQRAGKRQLLPQNGAGRTLAVCELGAALQAEAAGDTRAALALARKALALAPAFTPALGAVARLWAAAGETRKARRLLEKNWPRAPHPELAAAYLAASGADAAGDRLRALEKLTAGAPEHGESRLALAGAALAAGEYDAAEGHLAALLAGAGGRRALHLMADLAEARQGPGDDARIWLRRAAEAPEDAAWTCGLCHHRAPNWAPHCGGCGSFDALRWPDRGAPEADETAAGAVAAGAASTEGTAPRLPPPVAPASGARAGEQPGGIEILPPQTGTLAAAEAAAGDIAEPAGDDTFIDENGTLRTPASGPR